MPFKHSIQWIVYMDLAQILCQFKFVFQNLYLKELVFAIMIYITCGYLFSMNVLDFILSVFVQLNLLTLHLN